LYQVLRKHKANNMVSAVNIVLLAAYINESNAMTTAHAVVNCNYQSRN
jgi:hypothetical protein